MMDALGLILASHGHAAPAGGFPIAHATDAFRYAGWILWLPLLSMVCCGVLAALRVKGKSPAIVTVGFLAASFALTVALFLGYEEPVTIHLFDWLSIAWGDHGHGFAAPSRSTSIA